MAGAGGIVLKAPVFVLRLAGRIAQLPLKIAGLGLSRRTWLLWYTGYFCALAIKAVAKTIKKRRDAYEGMDGIVSFSSRMIAGASWSAALLCVGW